MSVFAKTSAGKSSLNPHNKGNEKASFFGVQAKLNIGKSNDKFEAEADSVADKVVSNKKNTAPEPFFTPSPVVQSKASAEINSQNKNGEIQKKNAVEGISTAVQPKLKVVHNKGANSDSFFHASPVIKNKRAAEIHKKDNPEKEVQKKPEIKKVVPVVQLKLEKEESVQSKIESPKTKEKSNVSQPLIQQKKEEDIQKKNTVEKLETTQNKTESVKTENPKAKEKILPPKPLIQKKKEEEIQAKEEEEIQAKEDEKELQMSSASDTPSDTSNLESTLNSSKGGGSPLSGKIKTEMESGIGADFSNVRIHNDSNAVKMNQQLGAQAFATGNNIYFNEGKYNPNSQDGKHLLAHELTHTVQQGAAIRKKDEPISPAPEMIQGSFLDLVPNWIIDQARHIPGYTLFTVIVGYDPLRQVDVERTPINLVEGLMGLIPFGTAIFDKLQEYGILQQVFDWVEGKLGEIGLTIDSILDLVEDVWHQLSFPFTGIIDLITEKFNELVNRITSFVSATVDQVITWIKEALIDVAEPILAENKAWSLIKKIIKYDPLRDEEVTATTVEILEDFLILIDKQTELEQMREKGTLQKTADWLDTQVGTFTSLLGELRGLITAAWDAIQPSNLANIADNLSALADQAGGFLQRVWDFASGVALKVLELVKDSLLAWLSSQAATVRGYSLIKVIIGRDPFTNETVERTIPNVIRGFMSLMDGGEEQYAQMVETGAIARITGQIEAAVATLNMTPEAIIQLFTDLWNSFTIDDLIHPLDAFVRIIEKFGEPIGRLIAFVAEIIRIVIVAILEIMNFPFDLIGNIITRAMQAIEDIKKDPIGFLKNILRAIKQGFVQFFDNIVTHLISGVTGWLMSELKDANLPVLSDFSLRGVISWVLEVLGISMEKIWEKLAAHPRIGPARVARIRGMINTLEGIWTFIKDVQERGIAAIWDKIQEQLSNLWNTVLDAVKNFIMERIVNRITARLLSMLDPTGIMAVINGAMALYNAIQSFIKYLREMLEVVNSFVNGVADIAKGNVTTAANYLERTMGEAMPIVIGFLANQVGLAGIGARVGEMIISVQQMVDEALTWLVNKAVDTGMNMLDRLMGRNQPEAAPAGGNEQNFEVSSPTHMKATSHTLRGKVINGTLQFILESDPVIIESVLVQIIGAMPETNPNKTVLIGFLSMVRNIEHDYNANENEILRGVTANTPETRRAAKEAYILRRQAEISNTLQDVANRFQITELNAFFAAAPSQRYIPRGSQQEIGDFIRSNLYNSMHSWSTFRDSYMNTHLPSLITRINTVKATGNISSWQLLKTEGVIENNANISTYDPSTITYALDHDTPVAQLWNNQGYNADSDNIRKTHFLNTSNLKIMTRRQNSAKGSGGIQYRPFVGPDFVSSIADGGAKSAKRIGGQKFKDASGNEIN